MSKLASCLIALWVTGGLLPAQTPKTAPKITPKVTPALPEHQHKIKGKLPLPPLPKDAFTVVVIPDTQYYTGRGCKGPLASDQPVENRHLAAQIEWILQHQKDQNIVFVSHVGDIVEDDRIEEWDVAKKHIDRLRGVVPFSLTVGNHDMDNDGNAHLFQKTFPAKSFQQYPWYLGSYTHNRPDQRISCNNVNSAQLFQAGGIDFLHLSLECNAPDDVVAWADQLIRKYPRHRCLITTHMDLGAIDKPKPEDNIVEVSKGRMRWVKIHGSQGNTGEQLWDKLYRKHPNIDMIFCGDQSKVTALRDERKADDGHVIQAMLSDYFSLSTLRLVRFMPKQQRVEVLTWQVMGSFLVEEAGHVKDRHQHQFSFEWKVSR